MRKIIHVDCDCFFAAVEMRDRPELRDVPLAVGGSPQRRGVISTCNYIARRFGVHSAMPSSHAQRLCRDLIILPPDFARYKAASDTILDIYRDFTARVEPLSLDEAYLDVTGLPHCQGSATRMATAIRARIAAEVGITASAGIAPCKFLAKVASDWNKPDGQFLIRPDDVDAFVAELEVGKIPGVGKVTAAQLNRAGVVTCGDLRTWELARLVQEFGRFGARLYELARGVDTREVTPERERKSISVEETFDRDLPDLAAVLAQLPPLLERLTRRIERAGEPPFRGLSVKIKFADFTQTTVEHVATRIELDALIALTVTGHARGNKAVRLLGVGVRLRDAGPDGAPRQLTLWD
jgi:DNA polymerase-4